METQGSFELDQAVFRLVDATRSIGLEEGSDLLLQLLYLRWAVDRQSESQGWGRLRQELLSDSPPARALDRALREHIPFWVGNYKPIDQDGGHALFKTVESLSSWSFDSASPRAQQGEIRDAFESVLRLRSQHLSRAGVESETPPGIARLMARLASTTGPIIDPACGVGNALLEAASVGPERLVGCELNTTTAARAFMRFDLADISADIRVGDVLRELDGVGRFDAVLIHPPWGQRLTDDQWAQLPLFRYGKPGRATADFVWLQVAESMIANDGRAVVLMPQGTLVRGHSEGQIRAGMLKAGVVEAVIVLPPGLVQTTSLGSCIWVLRAATAPSSSPVLLMDASSLIEPRGAGLELTAEIAEELAGAVLRWRDGGDQLGVPDHVARLVAVDEVLDAGALVPQRHLSPPPVNRPTRPTPPHRLLTEVRVQNFKSFSETQHVPLAPITVIYGPNSAGKSSLLQSLLLLKQSASADSLVTQGELTDAGSFAGALHRHDIERTLRIGLSFGASEHWEVEEGVPDPELLRSVDFTFRADGSGLPRQHDVVIGFGEFEIPFEQIELQTAAQASKMFAVDLEAAENVFLGLASGTLLYPFDSRKRETDDPDEAVRLLRSRERTGKRALRLLRDAGIGYLPAPSDGLLPSWDADVQRMASQGAGTSSHETGIVNSYVKRTLQLAVGVSKELRFLFDEMSYLGPLRSPPQRFYNRAAAAAGVGSAGEHIALHLFDNSSEVAQVNQWLTALEVPYSLEVVPVVVGGSTSIIGDLVAIVLTDHRSSVEVSPADVGFGVSQLLPIVVQLLAAQDSVICVEQPEIHLHPGLQARLGDLLIEATSPEGRANQVLVETHSEHLMLRLQRRIRERALDSARVSVIYVAQGLDGEARVTQLRLDEDGDFLDEWPEGFFEERLDELFGGAE